MQKNLLAAIAVLGASAAMAAPAAAADVTIAFSKDVYLPGEPAHFSVTGEPGTLVWLGFDSDPGPTTLPGLGTFQLGFSSGFLYAALPPIPPSGVIELTWQCNNPCVNPITGMDIWIQGIALDPMTMAFSQTNATRLNVEDLYGDCPAEGCTPGFWKNHAEDWAPTGLSPWDDFDLTFGVDGYSSNATLIEALNPPTELMTFGAHAVAALLNALHPGVDYAISAQQVIDVVRAALESGDAQTIEDAKDLLGDLNEKGCPQ